LRDGRQSGEYFVAVLGGFRKGLGGGRQGTFDGL
jgi:hypothetical protein